MKLVSGILTQNLLAKYPPLRNLIEALNAYNMRRLNRQHRAWAWIEEKVIQIPSYTVDITNDPKWDPSSTKPNDRHNIYNEFIHEWQPLSKFPERKLSKNVNGCLKYRLAIFIHMHPLQNAAGTTQKSRTVYSVSIWDREVCLI